VLIDPTERDRRQHSRSPQPWPIRPDWRPSREQLDELALTLAAGYAVPERWQPYVAEALAA
jgi:hypothetical protein